jgi:type IV pilus assembly protein PilC
MTIPFLNRITVKDRAFLARQLATMLSSGIAITQAIKVLVNESKNEKVKVALTQVVRDIEDGSTFSNAIEHQPELFGSVYTAVARSGEATGKLEDVLLQLANNIEQEAVLISRIRSVMIYPAFILAAMIAVAILMIVRVMPQLKSIFLESGAELPLSTQFLLNSSDFVVNYWWIVIAVIVAFLFWFRYFLKTPTGILALNQLQVRLPGGLGESLYMSRFSRTMSMLVKAGISIIQGLEITGHVMNNVIYEESLLQAKSQIERGIPLSTPIGQNRFFPKIVAEMVLVGEQTGKLDEILDKMALYYESELDTKVKGLSSLIEPIIIVILGIGVAFLVTAVLMPIYNISSLQ